MATEWVRMEHPNIKNDDGPIPAVVTKKAFETVHKAKGFKLSSDQDGIEQQDATEASKTSTKKGA